MKNSISYVSKAHAHIFQDLLPCVNLLYELPVLFWNCCSCVSIRVLIPVSCVSSFQFSDDGFSFLCSPCFSNLEIFHLDFGNFGTDNVNSGFLPAPFCFMVALFGLVTLVFEPYFLLLYYTAKTLYFAWASSFEPFPRVHTHVAVIYLPY